LKTLYKALLITAPAVALVGCSLPQRQKVIEDSRLLANLHGKIIYETYNVDKEDYPYDLPPFSLSSLTLLLDWFSGGRSL